jgi:hypothetical protein
MYAVYVIVIYFYILVPSSREAIWLADNTSLRNLRSKQATDMKRSRKPNEDENALKPVISTASSRSILLLHPPISASSDFGPKLRKGLSH